MNEALWENPTDPRGSNHMKRHGNPHVNLESSNILRILMPFLGSHHMCQLFSVRDNFKLKALRKE